MADFPLLFGEKWVIIDTDAGIDDAFGMYVVFIS